jgi:hypothetical protein
MLVCAATTCRTVHPAPAPGATQIPIPIPPLNLIFSPGTWDNLSPRENSLSSWRERVG